jgi:hypothetical protein
LFVTGDQSKELTKRSCYKNITGVEAEEMINTITSDNKFTKVQFFVSYMCISLLFGENANTEKNNFKMKITKIPQ